MGCLAHSYTSNTMTTPIDYAAIRAMVGAAKRSGIATTDGSKPKPAEKESLPPPINPDLPDWLLKSMHATREASHELRPRRER